MPAVLGWDIGGVNTKVARVAADSVLSVRSRPFELQHDPGALIGVLRELAAETGATDSDAHAVTMTAELSQMFRTKRDGVRFVLEAVAAAFPGAAIHVYAVDGQFLSVADAIDAPRIVAAANWAATARVAARSIRDAVLIDIGTTSTDIIPIVDGEVVALGWTDPDRLASGELVYSGAVRTPVEALAPSVIVDNRTIGLSAEAFALAGDVHVWRGDLDPDAYSAPTPDRRPATREFAGERLARAICADREMVDAAGVSAIADSLAEAQVERIATAIAAVRDRHSSLRTAVVTGLGAFIAARAAARAGLEVTALADVLGDGAAKCAPAASVALLYAARVSPGSRRAAHAYVVAPAIDTVVKVGGGLLAEDGCLERVLRLLADIAREDRLLVVPGGGPFADAVRREDARLRLTDDAAHWMAVLAMDQYAHLIASRSQDAVLVSDAAGAVRAAREGRLPVLAPYACLRRADPLPHSWEVTSDSLAAWIARDIGAGRLVLVKPSGTAAGAGSVDPYFARARGTLKVEILPADAIETLRQTVRH